MRCWFACVLVVLVSVVSAAAGEVITTLTVEEESGFDRVNEPVTMGVPLPEGKVAHADLLALTDSAGNEIACQVTEVTRWIVKDSVKWVHLTWNQSVKAKEKVEVRVVLRKELPPPQPPKSPQLIYAVENDNTVTVMNRYVKFVVRGAKFNGFDAAWFDAGGKMDFTDANRVIGGGGGGSRSLAPDKAAVKVENAKFVIPDKDAVKTFLSANDAEGRVVVEEQGTRRVVVKATGRHLDGDGKKMLDYIVRFYAYADSPVVRVQHVFVGAHNGVEFMDGLYFDVPTTLGGVRITCGTEALPLVTEGGAQFEVLQDTSDHFAVRTGYDKVVVAEGKGKSTKPQTTGWIDLSKGNLGLAVGVKWFWQMFPKSLSVERGGMLRIGLFPQGVTEPLEVWMGQSRTHYLTFVFHDAKTAAADLNNIFGGQHRPLRAWASPKYYCRDTHCFGYSVESDHALFGENAPKAKHHDDIMLGSIRQLIASVDRRNRNGVSMESYGIYAWGDLYHWAWGDWKVSPFHTAKWKLSWEGNYYDHPHAMLMQFIRTGEKLFLERYWPNAIQIGDVHTCNYHPRKELIGACRYCPPRNFVAQDEGNVYISPEYNHYKTQSVFAHWYLTGDRRSMDHCEMLANNAYENHAADSGWAARGVGSHIGGLWNAYELWRDKKYLDRMKDMAARAMSQFKNGRYEKGGQFMWGIANEGLAYYYWMTGDRAVIETLARGIRGMGSEATRYSNMSFCLALMYRATGDPRYANMAWSVITRAGVTPGIHEGGLVFRNTHFALFLLSDAAKDWAPLPGMKLPLDGFAAAQEALKLPAAAEPPTIDGAADDAAWKTALRLAPFTESGAPPTTAMLAYDKDNLYIALIADEPETAKLKATVKTRDDKVYGDDSFEVYIDPANRKEREFIGLFVNSLGAQYDRNREQAGAWNGEWTSKARVSEGKSWSVELAVPWKTLGVVPAPGHKLGLAIVRNRVLDRTRTQHSYMSEATGDPKDSQGHAVFVLAE